MTGSIAINNASGVVTYVSASTGAGTTVSPYITDHKLTDGTNAGTFKAASTAAVATDTSFVVALSPNTNLNGITNPIVVSQSAGTNLHIVVDAGSANIGGVELIDSGGANKLSINSNGQAATQSTTPVIGTATITRPANTTTYTANTQVSATANGSTGSPMSFTLASINGGGGVIVSAVLNKSTTVTTNATFNLHLFDQATPTLTSLGDNNNYPAPPTNTDYANYLGYIAFNIAVATANGVMYIGAPSQQLMAFLCAGGSKVVYGVLEVTGAYAPGSGEVFSIRLVATPN